MSAGAQVGRPKLGVAVRALIPNVDGRLLLMRRASDAASEPGRWELPGGKLGHGEQAEGALVREVLEETGLTVHVGPPVQVSNLSRRGTWVTCVAFACTPTDETPTLCAEHDDFAWVEVSGGGGPDREAWAAGVSEQINAYRELVAPNR